MYKRVVAESEWSAVKLSFTLLAVVALSWNVSCAPTLRSKIDNWWVASMRCVFFARGPQGLVITGDPEGESKELLSTRALLSTDQGTMVYPSTLFYYFFFFLYHFLLFTFCQFIRDIHQRVLAINLSRVFRI